MNLALKLFIVFTLFGFSLAQWRSRPPTQSAKSNNGRPWYKPQRKINPFSLSGQALVDYVNRQAKWKVRF
jgi:hypothetical protein